MKKPILLTLLLLLLSTGVVVVAATRLVGNKEAVTITDTVLLGSAQAASGLTVTTRVHSDYHQLWETTFPATHPGSQQAAYTFSQKRLEFKDDRKPSFLLYSNLNISMSGSFSQESSFSNEYNGTPRLAILDVMSRTAPGETHVETINLADYYTHFPLSADFYLPWHPHKTSLISAIERYIPIPVPENAPLKITVTKNSQGEAEIVNCTTEYTSTDTIGSTSLFTPGAFYFAVFASASDGSPTALPEEVAGLHILPYLTQADGTTVPQADKLARVFPFSDVKTRVESLHLSEDGTRILLFLEDQDGPKLLVLDAATYAPIQTLLLPQPSDGKDFWSVNSYDGFWVVYYNSLGQFCLLPEVDEGPYSIAMAGNLFSCPEFALDHPPQEMIMAYDGTRLAVAYLPDLYRNSLTHLMVFDQSGLTFAAIYENSLDLIPEQSIRPTDEKRLELTFAPELPVQDLTHTQKEAS